MLALVLIACASPQSGEDTAFSWPFSRDTGEAGGLERWSPDRIVLSWEVTLEDGEPAPASGNVLHITAASDSWDGDVQSEAGHCTAQRSLDELEAGDALAAAGADLLTLYSPPGADIAALGDCARLELAGWEGAAAQGLAEGLYGADGWLLGVGVTALFEENLGELSAFALAGYARLGSDDEAAVTNAVFLIDTRTLETFPVEVAAGLPNGRLVAPAWFAIPAR